MRLLKSASRFSVMPDLDNIIQQYLNLEKKVQAAMKAICGPHCRGCTKVCCREELCRETIEAPFLCLLREESLPSAPYSSGKGWLTNTGCALSTGRAPVCYHFLCTDILAAQGARLDRYMLEVLAALINHIGKNALGSRHLVEILDIDDLHRIKLPRFLKNLDEARAAFNAVEAYLITRCFDENSIPDLTKILPHCPIVRHPEPFR
jgi:hypothetical protein